MSYQYRKNNSDEQELVISGFEQGIADSPFNGIGNIQNLVVSYVDGIAYVNYKKKPCTISGGTMGKPLYSTQSPAGTIYISDDNKQIWKQSAVNSSTFNLLTGNYTGENIYGIQFWSNYLIVFYSSRIEINGDGTGDGAITSGNWNTGASASGVWPIRSTTLTLTGSPASGSTSATLSTYTDAQGNARAFWNGPSGTFFLNFTLTGSISQTVVARLTQGSADISWTPALNAGASSSSVGIEPIKTNTSDVGAGTHMSIVSINDGNLYFCQGSYVGAFQATPFQTVAKGNMKTFTYNCAALGLPKTDGSIWLTEMRNQLLIAGFEKIYPWDRVSAQWSNPIPVFENISKMTNILNTVYILAGTKGNIYFSNGYNAELLTKIPDYISGVIDPQWSFGGIMEHRNQLYFQAIATNSATGSNIFGGAFKLDINKSVVTLDSQFSGGLLPTGLSTTGGILINNNSLTPLAYDNYYSAYSATTSAIDYNDTSLWTSGECLIETDIIPIGTAVQPVTYSSAEFKLAQPLASGDSISLYARKSLSDSYTLIGTTSTAVLSDFYDGLSFEEWQWIQFKVIMSTGGSSTTSSRVRLYEIIIR